MRRRVGEAATTAAGAGNTSACAEKRHGIAQRKAMRRKYLRVCGEEAMTWTTCNGFVEIPPRVRRRDNFR